MTTAGSGSGAGDVEALARQYFSAWGDALRHAAAPPGHTAGPEAQGNWQQAIDWWAQMMPNAASSPADEAVHRFREQAGGWYGTMQQVAAQFADRDTTSADVAQAWRTAVLGQGDGLLQWMLQGARGHTQAEEPDLLQLLETLQRQLGPWLQSPAFGPGREHQARWQALLRAQQDYQAHSRDYVDQIKQALEDAFTLFEQRLAEHEQPGNQLTSARAMFDLWIDAAEEAYAKVALSEPFQAVYASLGNAQMRLRAATQQEIERLTESFGLPTRTEMDAAHRRIAELERLVRRMAGGAGDGRPATRPAASKKAAPTKAAPEKAAPNKAAPNKAAPEKSAPKKSAPTQAAAKQAAPKKAAPEQSKAPKTAEAAKAAKTTKAATATQPVKAAAKPRKRSA
ncbi:MULTISPECIES: class III poly(R)-hydroxyalkanoic acid synthase subunit PhaE [Stenotrophomonas]|uniref:Poly(3-hydroxyalkanoate) polymerase subunit PhaE n=1 Tax=Stenotrophomonas bentonitica TaxID=1450134 RepID=A0ABU9JQB4_9GAMM|nr:MULTISPECIES: class III poly(R)-hydroxyalkanoic acid synthase subunit PhaE [Stenotrophomonas]MDX5515778.1 class III poly(R)-hydroxyalkanoic acid synthase subunit PhaE [Stenotrophomonas sp. RG-453]OFS89873.1 class III poly(R)-hydroxyalkanoic acid synthase subunit PhaE [Stenotrophomonas sp. HMSC10F06]